MKKNCIALVLAACLLAALAGCVSSAIEKRFPERWEKTYVGMSLEEFKEVWPDAKYAGYGEQGAELYTYAPLNVYTLNPRIEFFVFREGKLVQYYEQ